MLSLHENFEEFKGNNFTKTEMGGWDHFYNDLVITGIKKM
jgi:hypothetical protein